MKRFLQLVCSGTLILTFSLSVCAVQPAYLTTAAKIREARTGTLFVFHNNEFWLNLHNFLYVLGRARNKERDAMREAVVQAPVDEERGFTKLNAKEQQIWRDAVASYATGLSKKDIVFDDPLPALTRSLAKVGDTKSLKVPEIDPGITAVLQRVAPIYRKAWWPRHRDANRNWQKAVQVLIDRQGAKVLAFITNAYQLQWPAAGFPVHISAYTNWAGAYSVTDSFLVLSSLAPGNQGSYGLETIFHEGMHQWDDKVFDALREQAIKVKKFFPKGLSHSLIFFTAGEAVRGVTPGYVPYAEKFGVWQRGLGPMKVALEEVWKPYLDGHGTRDEAFAELIMRTAVESKPK